MLAHAGYPRRIADRDLGQLLLRQGARRSAARPRIQSGGRGLGRAQGPDDVLLDHRRAAHRPLPRQPTGEAPAAADRPRTLPALARAVARNRPGVARPGVRGTGGRLRRAHRLWHAGWTRAFGTPTRPRIGHSDPDVSNRAVGACVQDEEWRHRWAATPLVQSRPRSLLRQRFGRDHRRSYGNVLVATTIAPTAVWLGAAT